MSDVNLTVSNRIRNGCKKVAMYSCSKFFSNNCKEADNEIFIDSFRDLDLDLDIHIASMCLEPYDQK